MPPKLPARRDRNSSGDESQQSDNDDQQQQPKQKKDFTWAKQFAHSVDNVDHCALCIALDPPVKKCVPQRAGKAHWARFADHLRVQHQTTPENQPQKYGEVVFAKNQEKLQQEGEKSALVWQCRKGIPDAMFCDPDFTTMLESVIASRRVPPLRNRKAIAPKRAMLAESIRAKHNSLIKPGYLIVFFYLYSLL